MLLDDKIVDCERLNGGELTFEVLSEIWLEHEMWNQTNVKERNKNLNIFLI